jgi:hypothetical protein
MARAPRLEAFPLILSILLIGLACLAAAGTWVAHAASPKPTCSTPCTIAPSKPPAPEKATSGSYLLEFSGKVVNFDLSGMEPDFDPLYRVVVTGTLHDQRAAGHALPNATLVLSAYLEAFQPDTTPILPDLLHPTQTATNLGGFLTGKAALVNRGGHTIYHGDLLSEIFADSTEHLVVDLYPAGAAPDAPATRLQGVVTLNKGGTEVGSLRALTPLAPAALDMPPGSQPSWQSVIGGLSVKVPAMLGTGAAPGQKGPGTTVAPVGNLGRTSTSSSGTQPFVLPLAALGVLAIIASLALGWHDRRRQRRTSTATSSGRSG